MADEPKAEPDYEELAKIDCMWLDAVGRVGHRIPDSQRRPICRCCTAPGRPDRGRRQRADAGLRDVASLRRLREALDS